MLLGIADNTEPPSRRPEGLDVCGWLGLLLLRFMMRTDGPVGKLDDYPVAYTFGVFLLQQYLIAIPGGRLQFRYISAYINMSQWLSSRGREQKAFGLLNAGLEHAPGNAEILLALFNYNKAAGHLEAARAYGRMLQQLFPGKRQIEGLVQGLAPAMS